MLPVYLTTGRSESVARVAAHRLVCDIRVLAVYADRIYIFPEAWVLACDRALSGDAEALESCYLEIDRLLGTSARGYFRP